MPGSSTRAPTTSSRPVTRRCWPTSRSSRTSSTTRRHARESRMVGDQRRAGHGLGRRPVRRRRHGRQAAGGPRRVVDGRLERLRRRARHAGAHPTQAAAAATAVFLANLPTLYLTDTPIFEAPTKSAIANAFIRSAVEGGQEAAQNLIQNTAARETYDPTRAILDKQMLDEAVAGGVVGPLAGAAIDGAPRAPSSGPPARCAMSDGQAARGLAISDRRCATSSPASRAAHLRTPDADHVERRASHRTSTRSPQNSARSRSRRRTVTRHTASANRSGHRARARASIRPGDVAQA
jgi:hypothetical protein